MFLDASGSEKASSIAVCGPTDGFKLKAGLRHITSTTSAEFAAIRRALRHMSKGLPQQWIVFADSRAALECLKSSNFKLNANQLVQQIRAMHYKVTSGGHKVLLHWKSSHSEIERNEGVHRAAKKAESSFRKFHILFSRVETARLVHRIGKP